MANRKLSRPTDQRMALLRNQVTNLIWYGRIETTLTRAKEVRSMAERLITVAMRECDNTVELKKETKNDKQQIVVLDVVNDSPARLAARRHVMRYLYAVSYTHLIFALLIVAFTFFYSSISFNPVEIAKNMQQNGGMIPGIRQGKPTSDFILKISRRITLFGALFLALLAVLPTIIYAIAGISLPFAASSLLIAVSVAMETMRQLESQMTMRHYKGFLN